MSDKNTISEIDPEGMETLEVVSLAKRYNRWVYQTIQPFCSGKILEIGSGIGNISVFFIHDNSEICLSDLRRNYINILNKNFAAKTGVNDIFQLDIVDPDFDTHFSHHLEKYDSIYALNIIEHVENDLLAIENCKKLLKPGGKLTVLVPAYQYLFNTFDETLMHYRRYTRQSLAGIMEKNNLRVIHQQYFNLIGIFGWWVNGNILRKKILPTGQMKMYNFLVPLFKFIDRITLNRIGLSVICVGEKK